MGIPTAPLDDRGVQDVRELAVAQDSITWLALSIFFAAEVVLLGFSLSASDRVLHVLAVSTGFAMNTASLLIFLRSDEYLRAYWTMLRDTRRRQFDVQNVQGAKARSVILWLHIWFFAVWGVAAGIAVATTL